MALLGALRHLERRDGHALRIQPAHDVPDGAVLAAGVDALQDHQQSPLGVRVEEVLQHGKPFQVLGQPAGRAGLVDAMSIFRIDLRQLELGAGNYEEFAHEVFHFGLL